MIDGHVLDEEEVGLPVEEEDVVGVVVEEGEGVALVVIKVETELGIASQYFATILGLAKESLINLTWSLYYSIY